MINVYTGSRKYEGVCSACLDLGSERPDGDNGSVTVVQFSRVGAPGREWDETFRLCPGCRVKLAVKLFREMGMVCSSEELQKDRIGG